MESLLITQGLGDAIDPVIKVKMQKLLLQELQNRWLRLTKRQETPSSSVLVTQ